MTTRVDLAGALVSLFNECLAELRSDPDALAWGGLRYEDATPDAIEALFDAVRARA